MEENRRLNIGICLGDINGVSPEILIKALSDDRLYKHCTFIIYGSDTAIKYHHKAIPSYKVIFHIIDEKETKLNHKIPNLIDFAGQNAIITLGQANDFAGKMAMQFLNTALAHLKEGKIDCLITLPLNKSTVKLEKEVFTGHTEYISKYFNATESMMLMVYDNLRVGLVTNHLPIEEVSKSLNTNLIIRKIKTLHQTLKQDFGIERPKIAVLGLNPHAGDNGLLGKEEKEIIIPAIQKSFENDVLAYGPYAADGFFGNGLYKKFDAVLAMYHDQGLIPFKAISDSEGVNYTAGLPVIRTSPDHGTAYDIAGKNLAHHESLLNCIYYSIDIFRNRMMYKEMTANPVKKATVKD